LQGAHCGSVILILEGFLIAPRGKEKSNEIRRNQVTMKRILALVLFTLLTGSNCLGQASQSNQQLSYEGVTSLSGQAGMASVAVGSEVQPYHRGHNAADVRPAMTSGLPAPPVSLNVPAIGGQAVVGADPGFFGFQGLTHYDQRLANNGNQFSLEPPDQALCVGNDFVLEGVNLALAVYSSSGTRLTGPVAFSPFFGLPAVINRSTGARGPFISDPKCYFDTATQRWFVTLLEISTNPTTGAFTTHSKLHIAVSQTADPRGNYFLYALDTTDDGTNGTQTHSGCPCFGDQPLIGADANGFYMSTNEFSISGTGFNGSQLYAMSKSALVAGTPPVVVHIDVGGTVPVAPQDSGNAWYSIQPATSPISGQFSQAGNGTEFFLSALDFNGALDNRVAVWAMSNTSSLNTSSPAVTLQYVVIGSEVYGTPHPAGNPAQAGNNASQKSGPTPLRDSQSPPVDPLEHLNSNDDRMNQAVFANGRLWAGVNTTAIVGGTPDVGIAFFVVRPSLTGGVLSAGMDNQGYVGVPIEDVIFPSIGVTPNGAAFMAFTLSGPDYFPSSAYTPITTGAGSVRVAGAGVGPEDGFTGYAAYQPVPPTEVGGVARWGDYTAAVADGNGNVWFATEYIGQTCTDAQYALDKTCGQTRTQLANWGTFIGKVPACRESDGSGDIPGRNGGKASFRVHEDDCNESGDSADFSDPGSGTDFHSTNTTSSTYDGSAHSLTMTGLGTNNGVPVAFTIVAVDSTLVPPGMFSITLSNAYINSGNLLDGSITLK
jgi:hypothetical protein